MSENLSPCLRSHHEIITEFIYVYTVQDCLMCIADCYFCASRLTFSSLLLMLRLCIWRTAFLWCCWLNKLNKFINSWWSRMSENSIYCCLIYCCLIYFVYMYVLWKWDSKMCILMVILRVITINYSHRTLIINFSLHFLIFFMVNYWGGGWLYRPSPHLKYWGGGYIPPPIPPGSTPMLPVQFVNALPCAISHLKTLKELGGNVIAVSPTRSSCFLLWDVRWNSLEIPWWHFEWY